jgi:nucleoside recognition membrane protein YjiH
MYRKSPILQGIDRWWRPHLGHVVHFVFVCVAVLVLAVPIRAQHDGVIYEKVREQEHHIDNTDQTVKDQKTDLQNQINEIRKTADDNHETLDVYKYVFGVISGFLTIVNLLGFRMQFFRGKESNG